MISKILFSYKKLNLFNSSKLYSNQKNNNIKNIYCNNMINNNNVGFVNISDSNENEDDVCDNSDKLFNWLERIDISIKKSRKIKGGNYVQIATVDENGSPNCRTVVFRGFLKYNNDKNIAMKMITDSRSEKVNQINNSPICEMVWWFSQSSEQYRIKGTLQLISNESNDSEEFKIARKQMWGNLSDPAREQFYWLQPGKIYDGIPTVPNGGRDIEGKILNPPNTFLLMLLIPTSVKYLRLKDNFAQNDKIQDNNWISTRVNP
jgi:PPOX class probable FMN-dependent enzyme